jgi:hypothetical protein
MSTEHKALVRKWFDEVWNNGRATLIDEMLTEHAVVHGLGPDLHGPAEFKAYPFCLPQRISRRHHPDR